MINNNIEGEIYIDDNNLPAQENLLVTETSAHSIFNLKFGNRGLWHRRMQKCNNLRAEILTSVSGGVCVIPNCL